MEYAVVRDEGTGIKICSPHIRLTNMDDARAVLRVFQLEYPALAASSNPRIMELNVVPLKTRLEESLRIEEVPDAESTG